MTTTTATSTTAIIPSPESQIVATAAFGVSHMGSFVARMLCNAALSKSCAAQLLWKHQHCSSQQKQGFLQQQQRVMNQALEVLAGAPSWGVAKLGPELRQEIMDNIDRISFHLGFEGTLTAHGQALSERATCILRHLQNDLHVPVSCHTAQTHETFLAAGGNVFRACVNESGRRVQHHDGSVVRAQLPNLDYEIECVQHFLAEQCLNNIVLEARPGSFALQFASADGQRASAQDIATAMELVKELVADNEELTYQRVVGSDDGVEISSRMLNKRFGVSEQMSRGPFLGCFAMGMGACAADERMFELCDVSVKVGGGGSCGRTQADCRLGSPAEVLDVLEWVAELRANCHKTTVS